MLAVAASALVLGACGGGGERQDANEPEGTYEVDAQASFPDEQKLARPSQMRIEVENVGTETIPNIAATVTGFDYQLADPNNPELPDPSVADPGRPRFVVDRSPIEFIDPPTASDERSLVDQEVDPPYGRKTAYVGTYTLGELPPGETATFRWDVTAVNAGDYDIEWTIAGSTSGKSRAVDSNGETSTGSFKGTVDNAPVDAEIGKDGKSVKTSDGRKISY